MESFKDLYIDVNGINTRYWQVGQGPTTILLIHGLGACAEFWQKNVNALAQHNQVVVLDLVGYGYSDKPKIAYHPFDFVKHVEGFIKLLKLDNIILVGHSLGGAIAGLVASNNTDIINKLVLISSAGFGRNISIWLRLLAVPIVNRLLLLRHNPKTIRRGLHNIVYDNKVIDKKLVNTLFTQPPIKSSLLSTVRNNANIRGINRELLTYFEQQIQSLTMPIHLIWGKEDKIIPFKHTEQASQLLPNMTLHTLNKCGHFPQYEYPQEINTIILEC